MTIEEPGKVDGIGLDKQRRELVLLISDHLSWEDEKAHLAAFELKIGAYLGFLNDRPHLDAVPESEGLPVRISLLHRYEPSGFGLAVYEAAQSQLAMNGILFSYGPLPS